MKRQYISPATDVVIVNTTAMLAASLNPEDTTPTVIVSNEEFNGAFSVRENTFFDNGGFGGGSDYADDESYGW